MKFNLRSWKTWLASALISLVALASVIFAYFPNVILQEMADRQLSSIGLQTKELWVDGARIHYAEGGAKGPTLILVHGFRSNMAYWLAYLPKLLENYHVVALDLPGHGGSDHPVGQKYDLMSMGRALATFVEAKGLSHFYLLGASMGGGISLAFASEHPHLVKKVALINPLAVHPPRQSEVHKALGQGENLLLPKDMSGFKRMQQVVYGGHLGLNPILSKLILNSLVRDRDFFLRAFDQMVQAGGLETVLPAVQVPTLIIQGDCDQVVDPSSIEVMERLIPKLGVEWIEGGAHTFRGAHRERALQCILQFFAASHE